jgi:hypothetical protein
VSYEKIDSLISDVYSLFDFGKDVSDSDAQALGHLIATVVQTRLKAYKETDPQGGLRMSNIGQPDRKLWYALNSEMGKEDVGSQAKLKFLFGDIWEAILLFLCEQAGHTVEARQDEVILDGVSGHPDAVIDGVVVDVKSASAQAFKKFKYGTLKEDDPFGYYYQLAGYSEAIDPDADGAFLAVDKQTAALTLLRVPNAELKELAVRERVSHIKDVVRSDTLPERCYPLVPDGKSGNLRLPVGCSYCPYKFECWKEANDGKGLRTFIYATGPVYLAHVENEPRVPEAS